MAHKKSRNPIARALRTPQYRSRKVKVATRYNRKVKHKNKGQRDD